MGGLILSIPVLYAHFRRPIPGTAALLSLILRPLVLLIFNHVIDSLLRNL
jgi:hypothetical protein